MAGTAILDIPEVLSGQYTDFYREYPEPFILPQIFVREREVIGNVFKYLKGWRGNLLPLYQHSRGSKYIPGQAPRLEERLVELLKFTETTELLATDVEKFFNLADLRPEEIDSLVFTINEYQEVLYQRFLATRALTTGQILSQHAYALYQQDGTAAWIDLLDGMSAAEVAKRRFTSENSTPGGIPWSNPDAPIFTDMTTRIRNMRMFNARCSAIVVAPDVAPYILKNKSFINAVTGNNIHGILTEATLTQEMGLPGLPRIIIADDYIEDPDGTPGMLSNSYGQGIVTFVPATGIESNRRIIEHLWSTTLAEKLARRHAASVGVELGSTGRTFHYLNGDLDAEKIDVGIVSNMAFSCQLAEKMIVQRVLADEGN